MIIREARPGDIDALAGFIAMAEGEMLHLFFGDDDAAALRELSALIASPRPSRYSLHNHRVAEIDGVVAGAIIAFPADSQPELDVVLLERLKKAGRNIDRLFFEGVPGSMYLSTAGVNPEFRGRGVGTALFEAVEQEGRALGYKQASLLVSDEKSGAKRLYEKLGYRVNELVEIAGIPYNRMIKDLSQGN